MKRLLAVFGVILLTTTCKGNSTGPSYPNMAGNWLGTWSDSKLNPAGTWQAVFAQNGSVLSLTGPSMNSAGPYGPCTPTGGPTFGITLIAGTVSANDSLHLTLGGGTTVIELGTVSADGKTASGTYTASGGTACFDWDYVLSGTWQGTKQ